MAYPINIVMNNRIWYDSRIIDSDQVVFQNVNYATGDARSVNVVRQRFMQDWARRIIPNSIRQGIGLTDPAGANDDIVITQGYAIIGGRFLDIPSGTWSAPTGAVGGGSISTGLNYLMIRVTPETEGDGRVPALESGAVVGVLVSAYTSKSHDDLILAKFNYNGSIIDQFVDYTAEQEWQTNVISPPAARPGLTTAVTEEILLRAGALERVNIMNIEIDKARFYLNAVFDDQVASTEIKLINKSGQMQISDTAETGLLGLTMLELYTGTSDSVDSLRIDSSGNLSNIGTINSRTMGGNTATDLIDTDSTQTMSNKTLTSPVVTDGTFASPVLTTPQIEDTSADHQYIFASSELTLDRTITLPLLLSDDTFVFEDYIQTLVGKTLTTPVITSLYQDSGLTKLMTLPDTASDTLVSLNATQKLSNKTLDTLLFWDSDDSNTAQIVTPDLTGNRIYTIPIATSATFMMEEFDNIITSAGSISFSADNTFLLSPGQWTGAVHDHTANNDGGKLSLEGATTGNLTVSRGGTGTTSFTGANRLMYATGSTSMTTLANPGSGLYLSSQTGAPVWRSMDVTLSYTGDLSGTADTGTFNSSGDLAITLNPTVDDFTHNHYIDQVGVNIVQHNPASTNVSGNGIGAINYGASYVSVFVDDSGDYFDIPLPNFYNQTVDQVSFRAKSSVAKSVKYQIRNMYDDSGGLTFTSLSSDIWSSTWESISIGANWTNNGGIRDVPVLRIQSDSDTDATVYISTIQITYT